MNNELIKILEKQHYAIVGNHSGVKLCHWMKQSLLLVENAINKLLWINPIDAFR
jgi:hypothetical protein